MRALPLFLLLTSLGCQAATPEADARRTLLASPAPSASASPVAGSPHVELAGRRIAVEVADTPEARQQGLSGRASLAPGTGMVLLWEKPRHVSIWMPDMHFSIDVLFVRDGRVIAVYEDQPPCPPFGDCPTFGPELAVDWVLEVPAGSCKAWGVKKGDAIALAR